MTVLVLVLGLLAATLTASYSALDRVAPVSGPWPALVALSLLAAAASLLVVRFRTGNEVASETLLEAVLAPLLFAFAGPEAVAATAAAAVITAVLRRTPWQKSAFNVAQWSVAVAAGSWVVTYWGGGAGFTGRGTAAVALGLVVVWLVNHLAFVTVLVLAGHRPAGTILRELAPVVVPGWLGGFGVNATLGLLYVLAFAATPYAVLLFPVPLLLLHGAYRGYAMARSDRLHFAGLHGAAQALAGPVDPREAMPALLREVAQGFDSGRAVLVLDSGTVVEVHSGGREPGTYDVRGPEPLWTALLAEPVAGRLQAGRGELGTLLADAGHRTAIFTPLLLEGGPSGCIVVLDQAGVESLPSGEMSVLLALAREVSSALDKGSLLTRMLEDRRRLGEIVGSTSDGILTVGVDGVVASWNPAMERITGLPGPRVVGRPGALDALRLRTTTGRPVDLTRWAADGPPPTELRLTTPLGDRRVTCSYDVAGHPDGERQTLIVVARDVTPVEDLERLRVDFSRLVEAEAAQRLVVEHLQQAVMPPRTSVEGAELGITYVASDPTEPTGGDLYDCQVLPSGELYLSVIDVLGHGVGATQDALTVIHTLRTVVLEGTPLDEVVTRADVVLCRQNPELVATVVLALFDPVTGVVRLVSGGHPPALVVTAFGDVRQVEAQGGPIGWPGAGSDGAVRVRLDPGDSLVLYTDGLIEARKNLVEGLQQLEEHAHDLSRSSAAGLAEGLVSRVLAGAVRRDDTLALVLRRDPVPETNVGPAGPAVRGSSAGLGRAGAEPPRATGNGAPPGEAEHAVDRAGVPAPRVEHDDRAAAATPP